jgi:hypothetical protein
MIIYESLSCPCPRTHSILYNLHHLILHVAIIFIFIATTYHKNNLFNGYQLYPIAQSKIDKIKKSPTTTSSATKTTNCRTCWPTTLSTLPMSYTIIGSDRFEFCHWGEVQQICHNFLNFNLLCMMLLLEEHNGARIICYGFRPYGLYWTW